jgi:hypothetical protein
MDPDATAIGTRLAGYWIGSESPPLDFTKCEGADRSTPAQPQMGRLVDPTPPIFLAHRPMGEAMPASPLRRSHKALQQGEALLATEEDKI